jgi:hypothetical protein
MRRGGSTRGDVRMPRRMFGCLARARGGAPDYERQNKVERLRPSLFLCARDRYRQAETRDPGSGIQGARARHEGAG